MARPGKTRTPQTPEPAAGPSVAVARVGGEFKLLAIRPFAAGEAIFEAEGDLTRTPTRHSIQVGEDRHLDLLRPRSLEELLDRYAWRYLNHSCEPNGAFRGLTLVALRAIAAGEELTFHYATTEYDMAEPFACRCGSPRCLGRIQGFKHLTPAQRRRLAPLLADHLHRLLDQEDDAEPIERLA